MAVKNLIITGASGMLGANIAAAACEDPSWDSIVGLYRNPAQLAVVERAFAGLSGSPEKAREWMKRVEWRSVDLEDFVSVEEALLGGTHIIHAAALLSFDPRKASAMLKSNPRMTELVFNQALAQGMVGGVHISSTSVLADKPERSLYGHSKARAEAEALRVDAEGLPIAVIRPSIILGAPHWSEGSSLLVKTAAKGLLVASPGSTGFVDVRDVASAALGLLDRLDSTAGHCYTAVGSNKTFLEVFQDIARVFGQKGPTWVAPAALLRMTGIIEGWVALVTGHTPRLSKDSVRSAVHRVSYDGSELLQVLSPWKTTEWKETLASLKRMG